MMAQLDRLREFMRALQKDGDAQAIFERFVGLVDQYGLNEADLNVLMSRDLNKVLEATQDDQLRPPVTVIGWWQKP
jgi:hypothetical protein